VRQCRP
jgi:hypothetical protein